MNKAHQVNLNLLDLYLSVPMLLKYAILMKIKMKKFVYAQTLLAQMRSRLVKLNLIKRAPKLNFVFVHLQLIVKSMLKHATRVRCLKTKLKIQMMLNIQEMT